MPALRFGRYDYGVFLTFFCYAACSLVVPVALVQVAAELRFPLAAGGMGAGGALHMGRSMALVAAIVICGFASGRWGNCKSIAYSLVFMISGMLLGAASPTYAILFLALLLAGFGEGIVEGLATPLVQDLHREEPGRYINFSHGFWSIGVVVTVLVAGYMLLHEVSWRLLMVGIGILTVMPLLILLLPSRKYEPHPDSGNRQSLREVCRNATVILKMPYFWLFFAAMFLAGGGEFGLTFWLAAYVQEVYGQTPMTGGIVTACFAGGMIFGRTGWGVLIRQRHLGRLIIVSAFAGAVVTAIFPLIGTMRVLYILLAIAGVAAGPFWPSVQSYCAERIPQADTTMLFILLSCAGVPGCGVFTWVMGLLGDRMGLHRSIYLIPACFLGLGLLILGDYMYNRQKSIDRRQ